MKYLLLLILLLPTLLQAKDLRIGILGLTYHLDKQYDQIASNMPRKIDRNGFLVWHPEINISYINENKILNFTYLKDCLNNDSFHIGYGKEWAVNSELKFGTILGILKRRDPILVEKSNGQYRIRYEEMLIPYPQIYADKSFKLNDSYDLSIQASTSVVLTHVNIGINYAGF